MNRKIHFLLCIQLLILVACNNNSPYRTGAALNNAGQAEPKTASNPVAEVPGKSNSEAVNKISHRIVASASGILARKQVPILCYHQLRDWRSTDSKRAKDYIVPSAIFREQIKILADSGYTTILPDQLMNYLKYGDPLPDKPVMLSFDDTDLDQYELARPVLDQFGFKGVFFIMTVALNKPHYMTRDQVKELSDEGHVIGSHTWDHMNVKKFEPADWAIQVDKPLRQLEEITGKSVRYFAYPFGLWKPEVIPGLKERHFEGAFQLSAKMDDRDPLYAIRRIIIPGEWSAETMLKVMKRSFQ